MLDLLNADDWVEMTADLAIGGESWTVERPSGNGVTGPTSSGAAASITGTVYRAKPPTIVVNVAQTPVPVRQWHLNLRTGTVAVGDRITSVATPSYRFTVKSLPEQPGEPILLERYR